MTLRQFFRIAVLAMSALLGASNSRAYAASPPIKFRTERAGFVSIDIYNKEGAFVRSLLSNEKMAAGKHEISWDGKTAASDKETPEDVAPGDYTWRGIFHEDIALKLRGWVGSGPDLPWITADGKGGWGGDAGVPSAVAADDQKVYLGWSLADHGKSVLACDLDGHVIWSHRRSEGPSGCRALAVDDGMVYVLGGLAGVDAEGGALYRLNARDGTPVPWPSGALDLKIFSFWPTDGQTKPDRADAMAVRHGHVYLSFTTSQFLTVLDAKTGSYLQTVVGAPPGMIDVAPTQTELPDSPGKLSDADFGVISLGGGVLGRILFAHDPFWVVTSDLAPLNRDVSITALNVVGDGAKFHHHTAYVGFGAPFHQVQGRPLLDMDNPSWVAGREGGRKLTGPWQPDAFHLIRGVAQSADGKLWVAEGDPIPKRFTVWDTNGKEGKLLHEFFGPPEKGAPGGAINPLDPDIMFAQGCEWRIDRKTGQARCLGVVIREPVKTAYYGVGKNGHAYLVVGAADSPVKVFERLGDGNYKLRVQIPYQEKDAAPDHQVYWADENGDGEVQPEELHPIDVQHEGASFVATRDLSLQMSRGREQKNAIVLKVSGWTACGAPLYEQTDNWPNAFAQCQSADGKLDLWFSSGALCCFGTGRHMNWIRPVPGVKMTPTKTPDSDDLTIIGSATLPKPIGNVWVISNRNGPWHLVTEDGFDLFQFFDGAQGRPGDKATLGMVMNHAVASSEGSLTHTANCSLFVRSGDTAYWNLELTGLDKVKPLGTGQITIPAAK